MSLITNPQENNYIFSSQATDWPLQGRVYIPSASEMGLQAPITDTWHVRRWKYFSSNSVHRYQRYWEVSYVYERDWRWKWFFCQSISPYSCLGLAARHTVFRREVAGDCGVMGRTMVIVSTLRQRARICQQYNRFFSRWRMQHVLEHQLKLFLCGNVHRTGNKAAA